MKIDNKTLKRIILEEEEKINEELILRETIRFILSESNNIEEGIFGDIGDALGKLVSGGGDVLSKAASRIGEFFTDDDELDADKLPMNKLDSAKSKAEAMVAKMASDPIDKDSDNDQQEDAKSQMKSILADYAVFMKAAAESLTVSPSKDTEAHRSLRDFMSLIKQIDRTWTKGKQTKPDKTLSQMDWTTLTPVFAKYKGPTPSEIVEEEEGESTAAGKEVDRLLDGNATKALKVAFSKAKNKVSVKEILGEIMAELPEEAKGFVKQALKELISEM